MAIVTTVLNVYRRTKNLQEQIDAVKNQNIDTKIWVWVNSHPDNKDFDFSTINGIDTLIRSSNNFKFHGRFTCGLLADTKYLAYFDDDTIPGSNWYKNCLDTIRICEDNGYKQPLLGSAGIVLHSKSYINHTRVGWPSRNEVPTIVDLVGHAWFFEKSLLKYLWYEDPISLENGEDIQFSYLIQKYNKSITVCPRHPANNTSLWGSIKAEELGIDAVASSTNQSISHKTFFSQRDNVIDVAITGGWKPLFLKDAN